MRPRTDDRRRGWLPRWASLLLQLAVTAVVAWWIVQRVDLSLGDLRGLDPGRWTPRWGIFGASCLLLLAGYLLSGALWGRMVREFGGPDLPLAVSVRIYMVANLGRYVPGKVWQIAGLAALAKGRGVPVRIATGAAVVGQGVALASAALLGVATLLGAGPRYRAIGSWTLVALGVLGVLVLLPPVTRRAMDVWFRIAGSEPPEGVDPGPVFVLRWAGLYLFNWCVYATSFWILVMSFELPGSLLETAPAFAAAYVLGYLFLPAPAGVGVREGFLTVFLAPVMGPGSAAALSVVARVWATGVEVVPAAAFWGARLASGEAPTAPAGVAPGARGVAPGSGEAAPASGEKRAGESGGGEQRRPDEREAGR